MKSSEEQQDRGWPRSVQRVDAVLLAPHGASPACQQYNQQLFSQYKSRSPFFPLLLSLGKSCIFLSPQGCFELLHARGGVDEVAQRFECRVLIALPLYLIIRQAVSVLFREHRFDGVGVLDSSLERRGGSAMVLCALRRGVGLLGLLGSLRCVDRTL